jgi:hypothetical protein
MVSPAQRDPSPPAPPVQAAPLPPAPHPLAERLKSLDLMALTPSRAFALLEELKHVAENE